MGKFENPAPAPSTPKIDYKTFDYDDMVKWCAEHGELEWLEKTTAKTSEHKIYPNKLDEYGQVIRYKGNDGKMHILKDKEATPTVKTRPISYTKVKSMFFDKFLPDQKHNPEAKKNKSKKKETMKEKAARLAEAAREKAEATANG